MNKLLGVSILFFIIIMLGALYNLANADTFNPCEYVNTVISQSNQLDTGNDENFERIKQQNNRDMVIACQRYEIRRLEQQRADLDRDNY